MNLLDDTLENRRLIRRRIDAWEYPNRPSEFGTDITCCAVANNMLGSESVKRDFERIMTTRPGPIKRRKNRARRSNDKSRRPMSTKVPWVWLNVGKTATPATNLPVDLQKRGMRAYEPCSFRHRFSTWYNG